jgi:hypothetical protein
MKSKKTKTKTKKSIKKITKKSAKQTNKKKASINYYYEFFTDNELKKIENNFLVNPKNINKQDKNDFFYNSGFHNKNVVNNYYIVYNEMEISTIDIANKVLTLFSACLSSIIGSLYHKNTDIEIIIKKNFKRFKGYIDLNKEESSGDIIFQMKLLKYILNENIESSFSILSKKKIINYLVELIEYRNQLAHQVYKQKDYLYQVIKTKKRSNFYKQHKLRNYNYIKDFIKKIQFIIKQFYDYRKVINLGINIRILKRNYNVLNTFKNILDNLCLIRERRKQMEESIKNEEQLYELAQSTLDYLNKLMKNQKTKKIISRNIVNLITSKIKDDKILNKQFNNKISNKNIKKYCKSL